MRFSELKLRYGSESADAIALVEVEEDDWPVMVDRLTGFTF